MPKKITMSTPSTCQSLFPVPYLQPDITHNSLEANRESHMNIWLSLLPSSWQPLAAQRRTWIKRKKSGNKISSVNLGLPLTFSFWGKNSFFLFFFICKKALALCHTSKEEKHTSIQFYFYFVVLFPHKATNLFFSLVALDIQEIKIIYLYK